MERTVMLALSTYRYSEQAVDGAIEAARGGAELLVVYVVDVNLARYLVGTDAGVLAEVREKTEQEMLVEYERRARRQADRIVERARQAGVSARTHIEVGRFALVCLPVAKAVKPVRIFTTRSRRPVWVRRFFGSPVDQLIAGAGCPVVEA
jgi:nucleotide-binding universal stress UspA family protein